MIQALNEFRKPGSQQTSHKAYKMQHAIVENNKSSISNVQHLYYLSNGINEKEDK
ncbi:hypothetical protein [Anaerobacillus alkalilacustris]|uniref:hypothetical protein n=1 Tax=Anaerobacillus alkalilacustris TaxID=393763 RepID=UPI001470B4C5|nr:hypothetical protein [Anaerobacillus alkalilacustris]